MLAGALAGRKPSFGSEARARMPLATRCARIFSVNSAGILSLLDIVRGFYRAVACLEGGGDFPDNVHHGQVIGDKIFFAFLCGGDFSGIECAEVLSGICELKAEEDNEPAKINPEYAERYQAEYAVNLVIGDEFYDVEFEDPFGKGPDNRRDNRSPNCRPHLYLWYWAKADRAGKTRRPTRNMKPRRGPYARGRFFVSG